MSIKLHTPKTGAHIDDPLTGAAILGSSAQQAIGLRSYYFTITGTAMARTADPETPSVWLNVAKALSPDKLLDAESSDVEPNLSGSSVLCG